MAGRGGTYPFPSTGPPSWPGAVHSARLLDLELLADFLPQPILAQLALKTLSSSPAANVPWWTQANSGRFSIQFARDLRLNTGGDSSSTLWRTIWHFKGPPRASLTLWMTLHHALSTADLLWRQHIITSPLYMWCNQTWQSTLHLLRDCPSARDVWGLVLDRRDQCIFFESCDIASWFKWNLSGNSFFGRYWLVIFRQFLHDLWLNHNTRTHNTIHFLEDPNAFAKRSLRKVLELLSVWA